MFYWLVELADKFSFLNVFRYLTVRTGGAMVTAGLFVFLFGPWIIDHLRLRQGKGQPIRADGPQSHIITKTGTPTMGGLMILSGLVVSTVLWANPSNPYVWIVLGVTLGFGLVGFYDDYLKVTRQTHAGFSGRARLLVEFLIAGRSPPRSPSRSSRNGRSISACSSWCSAPSSSSEPAMP
jgi:phospho-N-acetylmuramoyl-pentapeptide-transferase